MEFFKAINDHTRTTYYVLPLISLNKFSFGPPKNFINSYVTPDGSKVIVQVQDEALVYPNVYLHEELLQYDDQFLVFTIPDKYKSDIQLFLQGKYSKMSDESKDNIRLHSGLAYRKPKPQADGSTAYDTDARIMALVKDPVLRELLEQLLNVHIDDEAELISPPPLKEVWVEQEQEPV